MAMCGGNRRPRLSRILVSPINRGTKITIFVIAASRNAAWAKHPPGASRPDLGSDQSGALSGYNAMWRLANQVFCPVTPCRLTTDHVGGRASGQCPRPMRGAGSGKCTKD